MKHLALLVAVAVFVAQPMLAQSCDDREIPADAWSATSISADDLMQFVPRRVLIMRTFWESGPEALVIEDAREAGDLFALLAGNATVGHACGYHWGVVFEDSSRQLVQHLHNNECEIYRNFHDEIQKRLQRYFQRIAAAPTHYLLSVELDSSADPVAVAATLERDGRRAFFLTPPDMRFPRLRISQAAHGPNPKDDEAVRQAIEAQARRKIDAVIELLKSRENARVLDPPAQFIASFGDGQYEFGMQATVVFPLSFDASRLARYREQLASGARDPSFLNAREEIEPSFERPASYTLTLASPKPYSKELAGSIRAASRAVRSVAPVETERLDE